MKAIEKAKLALRKHLLDNKEQVKSDLGKMREISNGMDMFSYIENLSSSFSVENIEVYQDKNFDYSFDEIDTYGIIEDLKSCYQWYPPDISLIEDNKKDSDILSESFFFNTFDLWKKYKKQPFHLRNLKSLNFLIMKTTTMALV